MLSAVVRAAEVCCQLLFRAAELCCQQLFRAAELCCQQLFRAAEVCCQQLLRAVKLCCQQYFRAAELCCWQLADELCCEQLFRAAELCCEQLLRVAKVCCQQPFRTAEVCCQQYFRAAELCCQQYCGLGRLHTESTDPQPPLPPSARQLLKCHVTSFIIFKHMQVASKAKITCSEDSSIEPTTLSVNLVPYAENPTMQTHLLLFGLRIWNSLPQDHTHCSTIFIF